MKNKHKIQKTLHFQRSIIFPLPLLSLFPFPFSPFSVSVCVVLRYVHLCGCSLFIFSLIFFHVCLSISPPLFSLFQLFYISCFLSFWEFILQIHFHSRKLTYIQSYLLAAHICRKNLQMTFSPSLDRFLLLINISHASPSELDIHLNKSILDCILCFFYKCCYFHY